jgi:hypothetical protein
MAYGHFEDKSIHDPSIRALFSRESLIASDWYQARLDAKIEIDRKLWLRHVAYLESFLAKPNYQSELQRLRIHERLSKAQATLVEVSQPSYRARLVGMLGADPTLA